MPAFWVLASLLLPYLAGVLYLAVLAIYLGLLFAMMFATLFAEERRSSRFILARRLMRVLGPLAFAGVLGALYGILILFLYHGPEYFD